VNTIIGMCADENEDLVKHPKILTMQLSEKHKTTTSINSVTMTTTGYEYLTKRSYALAIEPVPLIKNSASPSLSWL